MNILSDLADIFIKRERERKKETNFEIRNESSITYIYTSKLEHYAYHNYSTVVLAYFFVKTE